MTEPPVVALSDKTNIGLPVRNLLGLLGSVAIGAYAYFGILESINVVKTNQVLMQADLTKNTEFRIMWPRGQLNPVLYRRMQNSSC